MGSNSPLQLWTAGMLQRPHERPHSRASNQHTLYHVQWDAQLIAINPLTDDGNYGIELVHRTRIQLQVNP